MQIEDEEEIERSRDKSGSWFTVMWRVWKAAMFLFCGWDGAISRSHGDETRSSDARWGKLLLITLL